MRVLVAGSTGYIGRPVVRELVQRGHAVTAVARDRAGVSGAWDRDATRAKLEGARVVFGEITDAAFATSLFTEPFDAVISCLASRTGEPSDAWAIDYQANHSLLEAAREHGAERFVLLSAICVQKPRLEFQKAKLAFESELRSSGLTYSIVRPTAYFKSLAGQIARVRAGRPYLLLGDGSLTACKPISERDLAYFVADCLHDETKHDAILPIGGPDPAITPRQQGELLFAVLGRTPKYRRAPVWMFSAIVAGLDLTSRLWPALKTKAELARIGQYYATESMLVWDESAGRYDAGLTPSTGTETFQSFLQDAVRQDDPAADLGDHSVFT